MSTRLPPEATDPSFRIGQSTTVQGTGAVGAPGAAALPDDDEPTARSMALNFADEPVERPALEGAKPGTKQDPTRPTNQQIVKAEQKTKDLKSNKSVERRHDEIVALDKRKAKIRQQKHDEETRKIRNQKLQIAAEVDRAKRKKLGLAHEIELKKKKQAWGKEIFNQDKKRALKVQEANSASAKSSAKSAALRQAAIKGVHANKVDPTAAAALGTTPLVSSAAQVGGGDTGGADIGAAAVGGGGGDGGASTGGGGGGGGGTQTS